MKLGLNWKQFEHGVLRPTLGKLASVVESGEVAVLLVGETLWHESDQLRALGQYPRGKGVFGPGLGLGSMEWKTWEWMVEHPLARKPRVLEALGKATGVQVEKLEDYGWSHFAWNLALAVAGTRLRYWVDARPLPGVEGGLDARAEAWFTIYNGSGRVERKGKFVKDARVIPWESQVS